MLPLNCRGTTIYLNKDNLPYFPYLEKYIIENDYFNQSNQYDMIIDIDPKLMTQLINLYTINRYQIDNKYLANVKQLANMMRRDILVSVTEDHTKIHTGDDGEPLDDDPQPSSEPNTESEIKIENVYRINELAYSKGLRFTQPPTQTNCEPVPQQTGGLSSDNTYNYYLQQLLNKVNNKRQQSALDIDMNSFQSHSTIYEVQTFYVNDKQLDLVFIGHPYSNLSTIINCKIEDKSIDIRKIVMMFKIEDRSLQMLNNMLCNETIRVAEPKLKFWINYEKNLIDKI